jgi:hypothetical protein
LSSGNEGWIKGKGSGAYLKEAQNGKRAEESEATGDRFLLFMKSLEIL